MIFSDETSFEIQPNSCQYVRRSKNESLKDIHFAPRFKHAVKVMIWGCMSVKETGSFYVVEGMMNTNQYLDVLGSRLLTQAHEWFKDKPYIFQQDLAPCHTAKRCQKFFKKEKITVLK